MQGRGRYKTKQKEAIHAFFMIQKDRCFTAEEVYGHLVGKGMEVGKTTVYRAINRLLEEGVLRRYAPPGTGGSACYQYNPCKDAHLHIHCVSCGNLAHVDCREATEFCRHIAIHHGFELDESQTVLVGRCKRCTASESHMKEKTEDCAPWEKQES